MKCKPCRYLWDVKGNHETKGALRTCLSKSAKDTSITLEFFFFLMWKIVYFLDTNLCPNNYYEIKNRTGVMMGFINCNKQDTSTTCSVKLKGIKSRSAEGVLIVLCWFKGIKSLSAKGFSTVPSMIMFCPCGLGRKDRANAVNHETKGALRTYLSKPSKSLLYLQLWINKQ